MTRVIGPPKSRRRRWTALWCLTVAVATGIIFIPGALAVHDLPTGFQLDGDVSHACPPSPDTGVCVSTQQDWTDMFTVTTGSTETVAANAALPADFTQATFTRDFQSGSPSANCALNSTSTTFCTGDDTTFATGSKDTLDITGWQCNHDNNVNSKIDIMNAYAAAYTNPVADSDGIHHKLLYFAMEKNKDNGTNDVGFWFLQGNASCSAPTGHKTWSGTHTPGDVLVVSEFTNGGGVSNITAYRWVGGTNPLTQIGTAGDCKGSLGVDTMCATTNSGTKQFNTKLGTPWLTSDATLGVGRNQIVPPDFFEGGIDLTQAFANSGSTAPSCFNTFIGDTRSSNVTGATLFDYARGTLGQCTRTLTTSAAGTANGSIGTGSVSSGTDTATLNITGTPSWGGTLSWYLCGPVATDACDNTKGVLVTSRTVSNTSVASDFVSGDATLSSVGRYCWTAHFEPNADTKTAGIDPIDDTATNECFTVAPVTATLVTSATCSADPCLVGSTLSDTATLSNAATGPGTNGANLNYRSINPTSVPAAGGSISWIAYGPDSCQTIAMASTSRTVSGNGTYPKTAAPDNQAAVSFTGAAPGMYTFVASYGGDSPNTSPSAAVTCANQPTGEQVTVTGSAHIASAQRWLPNDTVTLTGDTALTGTLTVTLYPSIDCTGTAVTGQSYTFHPSGATSGTTYTTTNSTFFVGTNPNGTAGGAAGSYSWLVHYDDNVLTDPTDHCETSTLSPITN